MDPDNNLPRNVNPPPLAAPEDTALPSAHEVLVAARTCVRALAGLPLLQLTPRQAAQLGGALFRDAPGFVDLVAVEVERGLPGLCDPEGRGRSLHERQRRVYALRFLWYVLLQLADQARQHYLVEQAAVLRDAAEICQETRRQHPDFATLRAAARLLDRKLQRWRGGRR